ncbi:hypothetical protein HPC49_45895 [Pyxidicoccus fallax]|uniref:Uncharacterized protein n=1 Tax=Pyxidicoccus fallax TaxID=394095 RepID=A0A848LUX0_9BACT|nr:Ig domain-containing protein [Pyxidicoccus fallax]NMO21400.1 hypothetical protein [Pyxidicoccus fallax]NPC85515.1 hypothetical protein [Pyxidicoccus fallax]
MRRALPAVLAFVVMAACTFAPDLSRFVPCDAQGACPSGSTCLAAEARCVPDCGESATCGPVDPPPTEDDAGEPMADGGADAGPEDAGPVEDGGSDAGVDAGVEDGGVPTALALNPDGLAAGVEGVPYSGQVSARGGTPPYTFNATVALPAGLTLDEEGRISGTPASAGDVYVSVDVTDQSTPPKRASGSILLRVRGRLRMVGPLTLANAPRGGGYAERLYATGGIPPYRFSLEPGSALPSGLNLNDTGAVTGTSGQEGTVSFTVRVVDSDSPPQEATRELSISTVNVTLAMDIATRALPDGRVGTPYSYTLRVVGASGPSWNVASGWALPPGFLLDGSQGLLHGTPTRPGDYTIRFAASVLLQGDEQTLELHVD